MRLAKILGIFLILLIIVSFTPLAEAINPHAPINPLESFMKSAAAQDNPASTLPVMHPTKAQRVKWLDRYNKAPRASIDQVAKKSLQASPQGSNSLLSYLDYTPTQRNQGYCGNCWAWAGTGVMEIALNVQKGIRNRLSVQYLNSNYNGGSGADFACCGGWLEDVASFYSTTGRAIPWANSGAAYADGGSFCGGSTAMPASGITLTPYYDVSSISTVTIPTHGISQAEAIANIKNVLDQSKTVWFGFFFPRGAEWTYFRNFWNNQAEADIYGSPNPFDLACGTSWNSGGGGHAVLCVGYYDDGGSNRYWIMVNSWGTTPLRPNGIFRVPMLIDYNCRDTDSFPLYWWQTLNISYDITPEAPLLIGSNDVAATGAVSNNKFYLSRFQALQSGTAVTFKLKATGPGNVKVAIYNESAGCPYRKLYSVDTPTAVIEGWNDFSINYPIVGSGYYWLAYNSDSNIIGKYTGSLKSAYRSAAFTGFTFPNVCDPYFSNFYNFVPLISCYGAIPIPPQTAPNLLSPGTSITFKWSAVYGATNYQLQVNTSPDFTGTDIFNAEVNNVTTRELSGFIDGSTYYWRVKAGNPYGWGDWSITRQVTADTVTP